MIWRAKWIYHPEVDLHEKAALMFRKRVQMDQPPKIARIFVSADSRYKLYVNGSYVGNGPLKGDPYRQFYETFDISQYLIPGENVIAAYVLRFPPDDRKAVTFETGPVSLVNNSRGGFFLQGESEAGFDTDESWKTSLDPAYTFVHSIKSRYAGDMEEVDGRKSLTGWEQRDFKDNRWQRAICVGAGDGVTPYGVVSGWQLTKRPLPQLYEKSITPIAWRSPGGQMDFTPLSEGRGVAIAPHTDCQVILDMGELVTSYVQLQMEGGRHSRVQLLYSECYGYKDPTTGEIRKGDRTDFLHGDLYGETDVYWKGDGGQWYEPFFFRTFRYLRISIYTQDQPLFLKQVLFRMTGYPLAIETRFQATQPQIQAMWDVSVRTLERCMHETYEDCQYYEQMQYLMDTLIESEIAGCLSRDDRLTRRALLDFHSSQRPDGMVTCNYPASFVQIIPAFSIYYIDLLWRHYDRYGDKGVLEHYLPTVLGILQYFRERLCERTGLVQHPGYWEFIDWVDGWTENRGSPTGEGEPYCFIYSQLYAYGLLTAAHICEALEFSDLASHLKNRHRQLVRAINRQAVDPVTGLYRTKPGDTQFSQHGQLWAVLSECVEGERAKDIMLACIRNPKLLSCSYSMTYYLFRAFEKAGVYPYSGPIWQSWRDLLAYHVTTWPEDPVTQRSECHGWSGLPVIEFIRCSFGVRPGAPGFKSILIAPCEFDLGDMEATICTVQGPIYARRRIVLEGMLRRAEFWYEFPRKMPVHVTLPEQDYDTVTEELHLRFDFPMSERL